MAEITSTLIPAIAFAFVGGIFLLDLIFRDQAEKRFKSARSELEEAIKMTEKMMDEPLVSFSCAPMENRKVIYQNQYTYELDELTESEPYMITYNDKRVYQKEVAEEVYQQLIKLDQAFTAFEKVREDYPLTMEELQENLGEEEE